MTKAKLISSNLQKQKAPNKEETIPKYRAQEKYQAKMGLISKSYKLDKVIVKQFSEACNKQNISQAKQLSIMMQEFIDKTNDL